MKKKFSLMKIISYLLYVVILGGWAALDATRNDAGLEKLIGPGLGNDIASFIIRYGLAFLLILYGWYKAEVPYSWEVLGVFIMFGAGGWITTDMTYNLVRDVVSITHVGTTSWSDRIFQLTGNPFLWQSVAKAALFGTGLAFYLKFYKDDDD